VDRKVSAATQNQALQGLLFLYSTMIYIHVMAKGARGVRSPLDREGASGPCAQ